MSKTLETIVAGNTSEIRNIKSQLSEINESLKSISLMVQQKNQTNWPAISVGIIVIVSFLSMLGYLSLDPTRQALLRLSERIESRSLKMDEHLKIDGHGVTLARNKALKNVVLLERDISKENKKSMIALINEQDHQLQNEMSTNNTTLQKGFEGRLDALDVSLRREMRLLLKAFEPKLEYMSSSIIRILDWQNEHDKRVVGLNSAQWERIKALERHLYGKPLNVEHGKAIGSGQNN